MRAEGLTAVCGDHVTYILPRLSSFRAVQANAGVAAAFLLVEGQPTWGKAMSGNYISGTIKYDGNALVVQALANWRAITCRKVRVRPTRETTPEHLANLERWRRV